MNKNSSIQRGKIYKSLSEKMKMTTKEEIFNLLVHFH